MGVAATLQLMTCVLMAPPAHASVVVMSGTAFTCSPNFYQTSRVATPTNVGLFQMDATVPQFTRVGSGFLAGFNAVGYNRADNFLYGAFLSSGAEHLGGVDSTGVFTDLGALTGAAISPLTLNAGDFTAPNILTVSTTSGNLYDINVTTGVVAVRPGTWTTVVGDFTVDADGNYAYGLAYDGGSNIVLETLDLDTGAVTSKTVTGIPGVSATFGAAYSDSTGSLTFFSNNDNKLYTIPAAQVSQASPAATLVGTSSPAMLTPNDGVSCPAAASAFAPQITLQTASSVSNSSATLGATINANNSSTTTSICYGTSSSTTGGVLQSCTSLPTTPSPVTGTASTAVTAGAISGLTSGTTYYYQVVSTNSGGTNDGSVLSFTTLTGLAITTASLSNGTENTAYTFSVSAAAGVGALTWSLTGTPPSWLAISPSTGALSGTPTTAGVDSVTVHVVDSDTTPSSDAKTFTITVNAASAGGGGGGGGGGSSSGSTTPTTTPTTSPTTSPVVPVVGPVPLGTSSLPSGGVAPGSAVFLVGGVPQSLTVKPDAPVTSQATGLVATGDGFSLRLAGLDSVGKPLGLSTDAALVLQPDNTAAVEGTGFAPNSDIQVYVFSTPQLMGTVRTDATGAFTGTVSVPKNLELGHHTLQVDGLSATGTSRSLSLGVVLKASPSAATQKVARATVMFASGSASLTSQAQRELLALARATGGKSTGGLVVGYVQRDGKLAMNAALSAKRANAVAQYLRAHGVKAKLNTRGDGALGPQDAARKAVVTLRYPT